MQDKIKNLALLLINKKIDKDILLLECSFNQNLINSVIEEAKNLKIIQKEKILNNYKYI
jgi:hypothetical protein